MGVQMARLSASRRFALGDEGEHQGSAGRTKICGQGAMGAGNLTTSKRAVEAVSWKLVCCGGRRRSFSPFPMGRPVADVVS